MDGERRREDGGRSREDGRRKENTRMRREEERRRREEKEERRRQRERMKPRTRNTIVEESKEIAGLDNLKNTKEINRMYRKTEVFWLKEGRDEVPKDGYEKLKIPGIFIKQKYESIEVLAG